MDENNCMGGYPGRSSVRVNDLIALHVSSTLPRFGVAFYRFGRQLRDVGYVEFDNLVPGGCEEGLPHEPWSWPAYHFRIPSDWQSGVYMAHILSSGSHTSRPAPQLDQFCDGRQIWPVIWFVVIPSPGIEPAPILYKLPVFTYQAYNYTGRIVELDGQTHGASLYTDRVRNTSRDYQGYAVTLMRPGGAMGGLVDPADPVDYYNPSTRRQTFMHWDAPMIRWLEGYSYKVDFCTDLDLHQGSVSLERYNLLLSVGHDEYWTDAMRDRVECFVHRRGNVAFFCGNTCWWRVELVDNDTVLACDKPAAQWWKTRPENRLTGVSYRNGGGRWDGKRKPLGFTVQNHCHWVYSKTGLREGDVFGHEANHPLVGYEFDGLDFEVRDGLLQPTGSDDSPLDFKILGYSDESRLSMSSSLWQERHGKGTAIMGLFQVTAGGRVFTASTTDWVNRIDDNKVVEQITRNVIDRLSESRND